MRQRIIDAFATVTPTMFQNVERFYKKVSINLEEEERNF